MIQSFHLIRSNITVMIFHAFVVWPKFILCKINSAHQISIQERKFYMHAFVTRIYKAKSRKKSKKKIFCFFFSCIEIVDECPVYEVCGPIDSPFIYVSDQWYTKIWIMERKCVSNYIPSGSWKIKYSAHLSVSLDMIMRKSNKLVGCVSVGTMRAWIEGG